MSLPAIARDEKTPPHEFVVTCFSKRPSVMGKGSRRRAIHLSLPADGEKETGILYSVIWNTDNPLPLGHPFRWVL